MYKWNATPIFLIAIFFHLILGGCNDRSVNDRSVNDGRQAEKVYATYDSIEKAQAILSSATHLDNLVAGERRPAGEHIWALNVLLRSMTPKEEFQRLFNSERHFARCYALIGMKISSDAYYELAAEMHKRDGKKYRYGFGCEGMEINNSDFVRLLDVGRIKPEYFKIEQFDPYLEDRDRFLKESDRYMINTGFGL